MFGERTERVRDLLKELLRDTKDLLLDRVDEIFTAVRRDYLAALGGGASKYGEIMPKAQRLIRKEILDLIDGVEGFFAPAVDDGNESTALKEKQGDVDEQMVMDSSREETKDEVTEAMAEAGTGVESSAVPRNLDEYQINDSPKSAATSIGLDDSAISFDT